MKIVSRITQFIQTHNLITDASTIVVGLSGGPDSVFLLHVLSFLAKEKRISLIAAHLDHEWRENSAHDAQFCLQTARMLGIDCMIGKLHDFREKLTWNGSQEEVGRKARRLFLEQVAAAHNATAIALAHHAQDQQETFFIRLMRGSSVAGLACMLPKSGHYIRPLLETSKSEILSYLHMHGIDYLIDPTNASDNYLRNRIRKSVIPALAAADTRFDDNFKITLNRLQATADFLQSHAHEVLNTISTNSNAILQLSCLKLCAIHPVVQYHVLVLWMTQQRLPFPVTQRFLDEIIRFATRGADGTHRIHHAWNLKKKKGWIWVQK